MAAIKTIAAASAGPRWGRVRGLIWPTVAAAIAFAILVSLGSWQLERKAWKEDLLARIAARAYREPRDIPPESRWPAWRAGEDEYQRVRLSGDLLLDKTVAVNGLAEQRPGQAVQGVYLFTPMRLPGGAVVTVNRGFVPSEFRASLREAGSSPRTIIGLARAPETRGLFVPANDPARDSWFVRDIAEMARSRGLERVAPFYVDADGTPNPGGWPLGGQTRLNLPNNHLGYAITWFGLAATLVGVYAVFAWRKWRGDEAGAPS